MWAGRFGIRQDEDEADWWCEMWFLYLDLIPERAA
jgi:hypothetical protein